MERRKQMVFIHNYCFQSSLKVPLQYVDKQWRLESYANGCVQWQRMAESIINTSHLIITSQKQARDACEIHYCTTLTNIMINNHWQYATNTSTHTDTHTLSDPQMWQKIQTLKYVVTAALPASYLKSKQIEEIACISWQKKPQIRRKMKVCWSFKQRNTKSVRVFCNSPLLGVWGKNQPQPQCLPQLCPFP